MAFTITSMPRTLKMTPLGFCFPRTQVSQNLGLHGKSSGPLDVVRGKPYGNIFNAGGTKTTF